MSPNIQELIEDGDYQSLLKILRRHLEPKLRIEAARVLMQLQNPDCIEGLIRSVLDDVDPDVRSASRAALNQYLGKSEAELAISAYGSVDDVLPYEANASPAHLTSTGKFGTPYADEDQDDSEPEPEADNIVNSDVPAEFLDFSPEEKVTRWDLDQIEPLFLILEDDNHPDRQLKALRIIAEHPSPAGIDALSTVTLWSENRLVKNAAYKALEKLYAEDTDRLLAEFRTARAAFETEEEDGFPEEIEQPLSDINHPERSQFSHLATIEPEGMNDRGILLIMVILFVMAAFLIYWFMLR